MQVHRARLNAPVARRSALAGLRDPGPRPPQRRAESGPHRPAHDIDPRQSRSECGTWKYMGHGYRRDCPPTGEEEAAGWGWPHARLRASRRTLGARRDQGGHGPPAPPIHNSLPASRSRGQGLQVAG